MGMTENKSLGKKKNYQKKKKQLISFTYLNYVAIFEEAALYLPFSFLSLVPLQSQGCE